MGTIFGSTPSQKPDVVLDSISVTVVEEFRSSERCHPPASLVLPDDSHYRLIPARGADIVLRETPRAGPRRGLKKFTYGLALEKLGRFKISKKKEYANRRVC
ncbi:hypothetical protein EVAR_102823_1 [Eumeta japonica]|uniref:Uncharacterized protein n=1 Tax=Eumeta variegata TaxID=151549 RepID=A0A4C1THZ5_EUMVA|nr:hypothetical protein EVAR_102823_1 [Eumeta japonica]